ncbi:MAG: glycoside hydrolase family 92 protein, partial [Sphingobacteriaceae bacterium]
MQKYDYPNTPQSNIIIDLQYGGEVITSWIEVINNYEIKGYRLSKTAAGNRHSYFHTKFSKPFKTYGIAVDDNIQQGKRAEGKNIKMYVQFDNPGEVLVKTGLSHVSTDGALKNLQSEIPDFDFKKIHKAARTAWLNELAKIDVEGSVPSKADESAFAANGNNNRPIKKTVTPDLAALKLKSFYTALYHTMLTPTIGSDIDGQYRIIDNKLSTAQGFTYYDVSGFNSEYDAKYQLLTLTDPIRTAEMIKSYLASESTDTAGYIIPFIADALTKGIKEFDTIQAYNKIKALVNSNTGGREGYRKNGFVSSVVPGAVNKTLRYAYQDWCIAQMAKTLNNNSDQIEYLVRAQNWKNLHNKQSNIKIPVKDDWLVPYDISTVAEYSGGKEKLEARLDEVFFGEPTDAAKFKGKYDEANVFANYMPYLYSFTSAPQKTQQAISRIINSYTTTPGGLQANDSRGQQSAWYVLSSLGIYNIAPGQPLYNIGLPQFNKAVINFDNDKTFTITNAGAVLSRNNLYIQGLNLDKNGYDKLYINYQDTMKGGDLEIFTGTLPNKLVMQALEKPVLKVTAVALKR